MRGLLVRDGFAMGLALSSYPVRPFSVTLKIGGESYGGGADFTDFSFTVGRHFGRLEIYGGWSSLEMPDYSVSGPFVGVRSHY